MLVFFIVLVFFGVGARVVFPWVFVYVFFIIVIFLFHFLLLFVVLVLKVLVCERRGACCYCPECLDVVSFLGGGGELNIFCFKRVLRNFFLILKFLVNLFNIVVSAAVAAARLHIFTRF